MTTEWGTAFCLVPPGFPVCPRCAADETLGDDISALWIAPLDTSSAALWYRSALEDAGYTTVSVTPSSDEVGSVITIESTRPRSDCEVQTTVGGGDAGADHPYSYVAVRYGTGCPPP